MSILDGVFNKFVSFKIFLVAFNSQRLKNCMEIKNVMERDQHIFRYIENIFFHAHEKEIKENLNFVEKSQQQKF